jgi:hypothetical protein
MGLDAADSRERLVGGETEAAVVVLGPDGSVGAEVPAGGVFEAFDDVMQRNGSCADDDVEVPVVEGQGVDADVKTVDEGATDGFACGVLDVRRESERRMPHPLLVAMFD